MSLEDSHLSLADRISADFHSQMLGGHLFLVLVLWAGELSFGLRAHFFQGGPLQLSYFSRISAAAALLEAPSLLPVSMWFPL